MKRVFIAALASLMLAGVLAGASEPLSRISPAAVFALDDGSSLVLLGTAITSNYGDSVSH